MKATSKRVNIETVETILDIYSKYSFKQLPKIIKYNLIENEYFIEFEWIEGSELPEDKVDDAFYELGKMHRLGKIYDKDIGFYTICHGDFHLKNIIMCQDRFIFIDVTYLSRNWNYSDLDYVDFFGFYDKKEYPWMIDSLTCLSSYHEGVGIKPGEKYEENIKNMVTKYSLEKSIRNGKRNNLDISNEERWLKIVKRKMANCT